MSNEPSWKFDKHITLGNVLTILILITAMLFWGGDIEKKIQANTKDIQRIDELQERNWTINQKSVDELKRQLERISDKLDQLINARQ